MKAVTNFLAKNAPEILAGFAGAALAQTIIMAHRRGETMHDPMPDGFIDRVKIVTKRYAPIAGMAFATVMLFSRSGSAQALRHGEATYHAGVRGGYEVGIFDTIDFIEAQFPTIGMKALIDEWVVKDAAAAGIESTVWQCEQQAT